MAAILWLWLAMVISSSALLWLAQMAVPPSMQAANRIALERAKAALLAYAATNNERKPGRYLSLPCPDSNNRGIWSEGIAHGSCGSRYRPAIGRLPWRTLGLPPLQDAARECIWYAVSGAVKSNPPPRLVNTDTAGDLRVYAKAGAVELTGSLPQQLALAILLAPGKAQPWQQRNRSDSLCGGDDPLAYLEATASFDNSRAGLSWLHAYGGSSVNDSLAFITAGELQAVVAARADMWLQLAGDGTTDTDSLLLRVVQCLAEYALDSGVLPWPAALAVADLHDDRSYDDLSGISFGRLPNRIDNSNRTVAMAAVKLIGDCSGFSETAWKKLWQNWKDHLFYAVAKAWQPDTVDTGSCTSGCLEYGTNAATEYAAIVWFAGVRLKHQQRGAAAGLHDWLEAEGTWPDNGDGAATYPQPSGNDSVFCLSQELLPVACVDN